MASLYLIVLFGVRENSDEAKNANIARSHKMRDMKKASTPVKATTKEKTQSNTSFLRASKTKTLLMCSKNIIKRLSSCYL